MLLFRPIRSGRVSGGEVPPECQISRLADSVAEYMRIAKAGMEPLSSFRLAKRALRVSYRVPYDNSETGRGFLIVFVHNNAWPL